MKTYQNIVKDDKKLLCIIFNDIDKPIMDGFKFNKLTVCSQHHSGFYHTEAEQYFKLVDNIIKLEYEKILFMGCSKSGHIALVMASLASKKHSGVYCWAFSPAPTKVVWGQKRIVKVNGKDVDMSPKWTKIMSDISLKECIEKYGDPEPFLKHNNIKKILISYTETNQWSYDAENYKMWEQYGNVKADFIESSNFPDKNYQTLHNTLAFYWKHSRDKMYEKIDELLQKNKFNTKNIIKNEK